MEKMGANCDMTQNANLKGNSDSMFSIKAKTKYTVECFGEDGKLKWVEEFTNLTVTAGLNKLLDATFSTGLASPAWYVGLKNSSGGMIIGDTMSTHAGWTESTAYTGTRPAFVPGVISGGAVDNSLSRAVFSINGTDTIYGCLLADDSTKGGAVGTLYGVGDFAQSRAVINGDVLNVTVAIVLS